MQCNEFEQMLDLLMDDALDADQRQALDEHARTCPDCAEALRATLCMKELMQELPKEIEVPLRVQNAWQEAVRKEERRRRGRRLIRNLSLAAAAVIIAVGIGFALKPGILPTAKNAVQAPMADESSVMLESKQNILPMGTAAMLAADGMGSADSGSAAAPMETIVIHATDVEAAGEGIVDTAAEYEGEAVLQTIEGVGAQIEVHMPGDGAAEFLQAVAQWDADPDSVELPELPGEGDVSLLLMIEPR